jgi:hypothetical protein
MYGLIQQIRFESQECRSLKSWLGLNSDLALSWQVCPECPDLLEDAPSRLCREATENYAANWWGSYSYSVSQCMGEPLIGETLHSVSLLFGGFLFVSHFSSSQESFQASSPFFERFHARQHISKLVSKSLSYVTDWDVPLSLHRVAPRSKKHTTSSKNCVKSTRGLLCWWMEVLSVKCTWVNLKRPRPSFLRPWTRYIAYCSHFLTVLTSLHNAFFLTTPYFCLTWSGLFMALSSFVLCFFLW